MATNRVSATYQEIIDVQTTPGQISIMGIHTPQGTSPYSRLKGFFTQFRKFRYDGISNFIMVPAAQLPVDPLGITGVTGTTDTMDPRDMLNPILFHGAHGESLTSVLNRIYTQTNQNGTGSYGDGVGPISTASENTAPSMDEFEIDIATDFAQYYNKLTDSTWKKFGIQSGVKLRGLHPLVHKLAMNMPILPHYGQGTFATNAGLLNPVNVAGEAGLVADPTDVGGTQGSNWLTAPMDIDSADYRGITAYKQMLTNGMTRLGWLPTSYEGVAGSTGGDQMGNVLTMLPKLFMGVLILPPAYNVEQFFRIVITHHFSFSGFTTSLNLMDPIARVPTGTGVHGGNPYENWIEYSDTIDSIGASAKTVSDGVM